MRNGHKAKDIMSIYSINQKEGIQENMMVESVVNPNFFHQATYALETRQRINSEALC